MGGNFFINVCNFVKFLLSVREKWMSNENDKIVKIVIIDKFLTRFQCSCFCIWRCFFITCMKQEDI